MSPTPSTLAALKIPKKAWTPAYDAGGTERPGAWVAEITDMPDLSTWPKGMRLIVCKERPHPGAQLSFTDLDGLRLTCLATNTKGGQLADLELRHRRPARCEDRIRGARDTGLRNLTPHDTAQNRIWLEIVSLALDLLAWMLMLALTGQTRRWEPKKLRLRLFSAAAQLVTTGRTCRHRFTTRGPGPTRSPEQATGSRPCPAPADQPNRPPQRSAPPHREVESGAHPTRQPGRQPAPVSTAPVPKRPHPANTESPPAHRRGLMNDRG